MSHRVSMTAENHGYTFRLVKDIYKNTEKGSIEGSETIATLAIIYDYKIAHEVFDALNTFIRTCVEKKLIGEDVFRHLT